jgi:hypothetical protein
MTVSERKITAGIRLFGAKKLTLRMNCSSHRPPLETFFSDELPLCRFPNGWILANNTARIHVSDSIVLYTYCTPNRQMNPWCRPSHNFASQVTIFSDFSPHHHPLQSIPSLFQQRIKRMKPNEKLSDKLRRRYCPPSISPNCSRDTYSWCIVV